MSDVKPTTLVLFDGSNYQSWRPRIILKLKARKLFTITCTEDKYDEDKDIEAQSLLLEHVHPSHDYLISDEPTARAMWLKLEAQFNKALPASFEATVTSIVQKDKSEWNFESIKVNLVKAQQQIQNTKCWFKKKTRQANVANNEADNHGYRFTLITETTLKANENSSSNIWFIDSGASNHFTHDRDGLKNYTMIMSYNINIANGA
ncbi:hypothetical protein EV182_005124, partial [Spiromyces aspiralis]